GDLERPDGAYRLDGRQDTVETEGSRLATPPVETEQVPAGSARAHPPRFDLALGDLARVRGAVGELHCPPVEDRVEEDRHTLARGLDARHEAHREVVLSGALRDGAELREGTVRVPREGGVAPET